MPPRPIAIPSNAEIGLVLAAKYETDLAIQASEARRRFHTMGVLVTAALLVLGYDVLSVMLGR